jgi:hypothetical protein
MRSHFILQRTRFFVAVEGESEQSFIKWLQILSEPKLHIHLDTFVLGGGGYKTMLQAAVTEHKRRCHRTGVYHDSFLVVDRDRAGQGDWSAEKLRREADRHNFTVCLQNPNHEGLLLRMMPCMESQNPDAASAFRKLKSQWPDYQKPMTANFLARQFTLADLIRMAGKDPDLKAFITKIGFML